MCGGADLKVFFFLLHSTWVWEGARILEQWCHFSPSLNCCLSPGDGGGGGLGGGGGDGVWKIIGDGEEMEEHLFWIIFAVQDANDLKLWLRDLLTDCVEGACLLIYQQEITWNSSSMVWPVLTSGRKKQSSAPAATSTVIWGGLIKTLIF